MENPDVKRPTAPSEDSFASQASTESTGHRHNVSPPTNLPRISKRALALPGEQRDKMKQLAHFMRGLYEASGLSQELIRERANRYYPGLSRGTIARLALPALMTTQSDVGYLLLDAVLTALGSNHVELAEALRAGGGDTRGSDDTPASGASENSSMQTSSRERQQQQELEREQEQAFVRLVRSLSSLAREYLLEDAQRYVRREAQEAAQARASRASQADEDSSKAEERSERTAS